MISLKKFLSLPRDTRLRKAVRLLRQWGQSPEAPDYMRSLLAVLAADGLPPHSRALLSAVLSNLASSPDEQAAWNMNALMYTLMRELGLETADWDFEPAAAGRAEEAVPRKTLPCRVYIDGIRSPFNVGSVFRTAECFGVKEILIEPGGASPLHPRALRSAGGCVERVPWSFAEYPGAAKYGGLFALELGGTPVSDFTFPAEGLCVLGSEELGVRPCLREAAKRSAGIVSLPLFGEKASLNVSVAFGILMYAWRSAADAEP
jgi:TrmH family RNA methyltransferase